ncbi:unnamed protein product, partial [Musa acuminata var. zebrina]
RCVLPNPSISTNLPDPDNRPSPQSLPSPNVINITSAPAARGMEEAACILLKCSSSFVGRKKTSFFFRRKNLNFCFLHISQVFGVRMCFSLVGFV